MTDQPSAPCTSLHDALAPNNLPCGLSADAASAIVSYSAGQWGGTRAAAALRPVLSELGCLPVSAMVHVPHAAEAFDEEGRAVGGRDAEERWRRYVGRCLGQLEWWGEAARAQRGRADPAAISPAFRTSPSERNAPT